MQGHNQSATGQQPFAFFQNAQQPQQQQQQPQSHMSALGLSGMSHQQNPGSVFAFGHDQRGQQPLLQPFAPTQQTGAQQPQMHQQQQQQPQHGSQLFGGLAQPSAGMQAQGLNLPPGTMLLSPMQQGQQQHQQHGVNSVTSSMGGSQHASPQGFYAVPAQVDAGGSLHSGAGSSHTAGAHGSASSPFMQPFFVQPDGQPVMIASNTSPHFVVSPGGSAGDAVGMRQGMDRSQGGSSVGFAGTSLAVASNSGNGGYVLQPALANPFAPSPGVVPVPAGGAQGGGALPDKYTTRTKTPPPAPGDTEPGPRQLIVNFLPLSVGDTDLAAFFRQIGPVEVARVARDDTGTSRAFGFVYYRRHADARAAIERLNGVMWEHKRIKVEWSTQRGPHKPGHALYQPPAVPRGYTPKQMNATPPGPQGMPPQQHSPAPPSSAPSSPTLLENHAQASHAPAAAAVPPSGQPADAASPRE